jgi:hypothetical protein
MFQSIDPNLSDAINKTAELLKQTRATIFPFIERPADITEQKDEQPPAKKRINATALFSFFTADIIKEEVLFTR